MKSGLLVVLEKREKKGNNMDISYLMIINNENYLECLVTVLSILAQKNWNDKFNFIFCDGGIAKKNKIKIANMLKEYDYVWIKCENVMFEDDILKMDLNFLKNRANYVIFVQSKVMIRKNLSYLVEKYAGKIAMGCNPTRDVHEGKNIWDYGLVIIDMDKVKNSSSTLQQLIKSNAIDKIETRDYFHYHPMVSLTEINHFEKSTYEDLDLVELSASVVKLFSSIGTRLRGNSIISKEWKAYLEEIPNVQEELKITSNENVIHYGIFLKKIKEGEVKICIGKVPIAVKKVLGDEYVIKIFKIPVVKRKIAGLFIYKYFCGIRIDKQINYELIDNVMLGIMNKLSNSIMEINSNFLKNYMLKTKFDIKDTQITSSKIEEEVQNLMLYDVFDKIRNGQITIEEEIRNGDNGLIEERAKNEK